MVELSLRNNNSDNNNNNNNNNTIKNSVALVRERTILKAAAAGRRS